MSRPATTSLTRMSGLGIAERAATIAAAADALIRGLLVVLPTDTVYGLAASAASREGLERLALATTPSSRASGPAAWHSHSVDLVKEIVGFKSPVHRRLIRRLLPGPVTLLVERDEPELEAIRARLGARPGSLHNGRELALRVPDHPLTREILAAAWAQNAPIVAEGIAAAGLGRGVSISPELTRAAEGNSPPSAEWIAAILDDGPTRFGKPSTSIRLRKTGDFEIAAEGVLEERFIRKQLDRTILFVCTGNTCRSPMAEAIASQTIKADEGGIRTTIRSAGVSAYGGEPVSREAVDAVQALGFDATGLSRHLSRELTRQQIAEAEIIFTMTANHARAVLSLDPSAAGKVVVLDPTGADVPDPIGGPKELYTQIAQRLKKLIEQRLDELDRA